MRIDQCCGVNLKLKLNRGISLQEIVRSSSLVLVFNLTELEIRLHGAVGLVDAQRSIHNEIEITGERSWVHGIAIGICFVILFDSVTDDHSIWKRIQS